MNINTDLSLRVVVQSDSLPWVDSPEPGVQRRPLAGDGGEVARATSIVRYAPGSSFARHRHDLGEEFMVLEGEFCDEFGAYGPGTYVKNPAGSAHAPWSKRGCTIFVKLRQLDLHDQDRIVVRSGESDWFPDKFRG